MKSKKIVSEKKDGFTLKEIFDAVDRVVDRANKGDKQAQQILDTAREKFENSSYAV